jgi:hypothetical protein
MQVKVTQTNGMLATNDIDHTEAPANTAIYQTLTYEAFKNSSKALR